MPAPVDEDFFSSAPQRSTESFEIARPAAEVWHELTRDGTLEWCRGLKITWTSPRPFGVGTTRRANVFGVVLQIQEEYFIWEEGRRKAFFVTSAMPPTYRRFAEDYLVEPLGPDRCRFTWTIATDPNPLGKLLAPVTTRIVKGLFADTRRYFA